MTQEKVKLTPEQSLALAEAIEAYPEKSFIVFGHAKGASEGQAWKGIFEPLNDVGMDELCRALYVGYEVVEPDQVVTVTSDRIQEIKLLFKIDHPEPSQSLMSAYQEGMKDALVILGVNVEGIYIKKEESE